MAVAPEAPTLLLRARWNEVHASWRRKILAVLRLPIFRTSSAEQSTSPPQGVDLPERWLNATS